MAKQKNRKTVIEPLVATETGWAIASNLIGIEKANDQTASATKLSFCF